MNYSEITALARWRHEELLREAEAERLSAKFPHQDNWSSTRPIWGRLVISTRKFADGLRLSHSLRGALETTPNT